MGTNFVEVAGETVHIFFFPVTRNEIVEMDVVKTIERRRYEKVHIVCSMSDKMIAFNLLVFLILIICVANIFLAAPRNLFQELVQQVTYNYHL